MFDADLIRWRIDQLKLRAVQFQNTVRFLFWRCEFGFVFASREIVTSAVRRIIGVYGLGFRVFNRQIKNIAKNPDFRC